MLCAPSPCHHGGFWTLNRALLEVEALSPMKLLQAATLKYPCEADPVWLTGKGSQDTSPTSEVKVRCKCPEERPRGESKILVIVSLYLCRLRGQDNKHSTSGSLPTGWLWGLPQEEPPFSAPSGPPGGPFGPSSRRGAHRAQEEGIKGPVEGAQAPPDSQHQDGTSRLCRPGKTTPPPHHGWAHEVRGGPSLRWDGLSSSLQQPLTLQPEAMLLWLTLALLWSSTCWAGGKSGWGSRVQSIPLETTLPFHHPGPGVWASSCHRLTQLSDLSPCLRGCVFCWTETNHMSLYVYFLFSSPPGSLINSFVWAWRRLIFQYN